MSKRIATSAGSNLNQWAEALKNTSPEIARVLGENRVSGFEALDELGLPHYERAQLPLTSFLEDPLPILEDLNSD